MLFLCLVASRTEQFGANQSKLEHVRTGHSESHCRLRDCAYLCTVNERKRGLTVFFDLLLQTMETKILRVVRQGEAFSVQSVKSESGQIKKCTIVLRELGGSKFENEYVCAMLGSLASCRFYEGDVVMATLRFSTHEYQGQTFQEVLATELVKIN